MSRQLSIGQAAKYIGVSRDTLRRWEKKGKIAPLRSPTNRRYYTEEQLDALLKRPKSGQKKTTPSSVTSPRGSLNLVIYSLLALLIAVALALAVQVFLL